MIPALRRAIRRVRAVLRDPNVLRRAIAERVARWQQARAHARTVGPGQARVLVALRTVPPVWLDADGPVEVHILCGRRTVPDALAMLTTFYHYAPPYPLVVHDDGTLGARDRRRLRRAFPSLSILTRRTTDREVLARLTAAGLTRCLAERRRNVFMRKLFDLQYYARGKRALYLDTDILVLDEPRALLDALTAPDEAWADRYNEDVRSCYAAGAQRAADAMGVTLRPGVNAGLFCVRLAAMPDWPTIEAQLAILGPDEYFAEQTVWALHFSASGGRPLPPVYDVCFRHAWAGGNWDANARAQVRGEPVVTQHYCGGPQLRALFYPRFLAWLVSVTHTPRRQAQTRNAIHP